MILFFILMTFSTLSILFYVFEASLYRLLLYQLWVKAIVLVHLSWLLPIQRHRFNILIFNPISNNKEII